MTKGKFYFLSDEYCEKFSKHGVMANKESTADGLHRRPCFYSIQDIKNDNIFWMIPVSSQIEKYNKILENKLKRYKEYDGLEFGYVQGRDYINPAMRPVFDNLADALWKEVTSV